MAAMMHPAMLRCWVAAVMHLVFRANALPGKMAAVLRAHDREAAAKSLIDRPFWSKWHTLLVLVVEGRSALCSGRRGAMASRLSLSVVAPALVLLGLFLGQCSCQAAPQVVVLGGATGWTDTANANYTRFMSTMQFKAGDTLRFNNNDTKDHDVYQVSTQAEYDTCNTNNNTGWTVNVGDSYDLLIPDPAYRVWLMDTQYCATGQKVEFTVLNADGTAVPPDNATADPPSLNALQPDPTSPPTPPAPPLALAGGPAPNAASSQVKVPWTCLALLVAACCFAAPALQHRF